MTDIRQKSQRRILGKTDQERKEINAIPLWVALRWFFALLFLGPRRAEKYMRKQDRGPKYRPIEEIIYGHRGNKGQVDDRSV